MKLTASLVAEAAAAYADAEPLYPVEREQLDVFPRMVATGEFGWRDAEWVVRWYYRRYLGAYPHADRQAVEARFDENDFEAVRAALTDASEATDATAAVERLTTLRGVDVRIASAFLMFIDPERYVVVGDREWAVLRRADVLSDPYPDPPDVSAYRAYLDACRSLTDSFDCDHWTLYRALWRLWEE